jgi:hypothetical protein
MITCQQHEVEPSNLGQITSDLGQYLRLCLHVPHPLPLPQIGKLLLQ